MGTIRPAAVAGMFYPAEAGILARDVAAMLEAVQGDGGAVPKAVIAPHAGYVYSGPIAASAYARLIPARRRISRVILLGPAHRVPFSGLALPEADGFATPLGTVEVDRAAAESLLQLPQVKHSRQAHAAEHSLEVHLPFLQSVLEKFGIVPLVVGHAGAEDVAQVIEHLWGGEETLIVVSSDLSHYLPYAEARTVDAATAQAILDLRPVASHEQACGGTAVNGLLLAARRRGLHAELLDLRNSGDTAGDRARVVGYAAFAFTGEETHVH